MIFANIQPSKGFPQSAGPGEFLLGSDLFAIRILDFSLITPEDLIRWGQSQSYKDQRDRYATGTAIQRVSKKDWGKFTITFPADQVSRKYFEEMDVINQEISKVGDGLSKSLELVYGFANDLLQSFPVEESEIK